MRRVILIIMMISAVILTSCAQGNTGTNGGTCIDGTLSDSPPDLIVTCGDSSVTALTGGYTWEKNDGGELGKAIIACSLHPLQCHDITPVLKAAKNDTAVLTFDNTPLPDKLSVTSYGADAWDNMDAHGKAVDLAASAPPEMKLAGKGTIYVVNAEWTAADGYGGKVEYSFYIS